ncbi:tRNA pseudouridine(55) synthase TruB [Halothiobacillus sp. DCM-1]|uniref:tRNA pseudouridine(55) synthase TruB n=1 Tax=Halothiobacillus sp. DCM-1 TaxID=3112558 RepID=UPI003250CA0B
MSRRRRGLEINGILLLDKPLGLSSNQALQRVKRLFNAAKAGHTGSLDPAATGMLPLCFGQATKVSGLLLDADKVYRVTGRLGVRTETGDREGAVIDERPVPVLSEAELDTVIARFRGLVTQIPPMYSALKVDGKRLYDLARAGETVERKPRPIHFYRIDLTRFDGQTFDLLVHSSKGAYIRTLIEDIGEAIGCGAVVESLRRVGVGHWLAPEAEGTIADLAAERLWTIEELTALADSGEENPWDRAILPTDSALSGYPVVALDEESAYHIRHGHPVFVAKAPQSGWFRLYDPARRFLGMGECLDDGRVAPRRLFAS